MAVLATSFHGLPTRVLAPKYGGCMTFGAVEKKELGGHGQGPCIG
jgi:3-dehydroquinate dehydratase